MIKPHCGTRLDRLSDCHQYPSMFVIVVFDLLACWSNAAGGLILVQPKVLGWIDNFITATLSTITTAGMFLGALVGGITGDKTGRRNVLTLYGAIRIASMVVGALSPSMDLLIACCSAMGVGLGALPVTLLVGFTEYMPGRNHGMWSSRISFISNWSYPFYSPIVMGLIPLISVKQDRWVQLFIPVVLSFIVTALAWRCSPELPRQLEPHEQYQGAEKVIRSIEEGVMCQTGEPLPPVVITGDDRALQVVPYSALLIGVLLKYVILGSRVLVVTNVVQYILISWSPTISMAQGINLKDSIVLNIMSMPGTSSSIFIVILMMDKIPCKTVGVGLLILIVMPGYTYSLQISMLFITLINFFLITFTYIYIYYASAVYVPEVWSTEARLRGSGLVNAVGRVNGIAAPYIVAVLLNSYGVAGVFILLGAVSIIVATAITTTGIGAKGISIESLSVDAVASK